MKWLLILLLSIAVFSCSRSSRNDLHHAAAKGDLNVLKRLVANGADVNSRDERGRTPLHYATNEHRADVMKFLLDNGADANAKDLDGDTPLHDAATAADPNIAQLLLEHGADPNIRGSTGETPLDIAVMLSRRETVSLLNEHDAKRAGVSFGRIEPGTRVDQPAGARCKMIVYSPEGNEVPELTQYGTELLDTPYGGTTLVTSASSRISPKLQTFPPGARTEILELGTGKVVFSYTY